MTSIYVHDSKALPELVDDIIKSNNVTTTAVAAAAAATTTTTTTTTTTGKLFAYGTSYEDIDVFRYLCDNGIQSCIKVRKNSRVRQKKGNT
jgi:hypothetical protein